MSSADAPELVIPESVKVAEKAAAVTNKKVSVQAAPIRTYLESTVVPLLMQGMQQLVKDRPEDPVEYLAVYLLKQNEENKRAAAAAAAPKAEGA